MQHFWSLKVCTVSCMLCDFQDETLMIHARKIQYMCMSKLSPQELASRAHQFLAEGDKKKQHSSSKALSSAQEGAIYINFVVE